MNVLFVCLGNICRSPMAETIFTEKVREADLQNVFVDSAGELSIHSGESADARMRKHAAQHGYNITCRSRQIEQEDFEKFDIIVAMDDNNVNGLKNICPCPQYLSKIYKMTDFCIELAADAVPDPYYGGAAGFELVITLLEDACEGLIAHVQDAMS